MFDIGWGELIVIGVAALIFIGPKELPGVLRTLGQWMAKIRRMAGEFQNQFHEALREAELADLKKEVDEMSTHAASMSNFDPIAEVRSQLEGARRDIESTFTSKPTDTTPATNSASTEAGSAPADTPAPDALPASTAAADPAHAGNAPAPAADSTGAAVKEPMPDGAGGSAGA